MKSVPVTGKDCLLQGKTEIRDEGTLIRVYFRIVDLPQIT